MSVAHNEYQVDFHSNFLVTSIICVYVYVTLCMVIDISLSQAFCFSWIDVKLYFEIQSIPITAMKPKPTANWENKAAIRFAQIEIFGLSFPGELQSRELNEIEFFVCLICLYSVVFS